MRIIAIFLELIDRGLYLCESVNRGMKIFPTFFTEFDIFHSGENRFTQIEMSIILQGERDRRSEPQTFQMTLSRSVNV